MRLRELKVCNVRGVRKLSLAPAGRHVVIYGPNGSGKSSVVDALDFLLTGEIHRLTGTGTQGITLSEHGRHIEGQNQEAWVSAIVAVDDLGDPITIFRDLSHTGTLDCASGDLQALEPALAMARRGQHMLTRRDILRYIAVAGAARATQIQELLNLQEVEETRVALGRASTELERDAAAALRELKASQQRILAITGKKPFSVDETLQAINESRAELGGTPLPTLADVELKSQITAPRIPASSADSNTTLLARAVGALTEISGQPVETRTLLDSGSTLRAELQEMRDRPELLHAIRHLALTEQGLSLLEDDGKCPLCGWEWQPGELQARLEATMTLADDARLRRQRIESLLEPVLQQIALVSEFLSAVRNSAVALELTDIVATVSGWVEELTSFRTHLAASADATFTEPTSEPPAAILLLPEGSRELLEALLETARVHYPEPTSEQTAWDKLTRLQVAVPDLVDRMREAELARAREKQGQFLVETFQSARDAVLGQLYSEISDRFTYLYRILHSGHEDQFSAQLIADRAGLRLDVGFYDKGTHPPLALHSEGHQDSMGLCLFLALAEKLTDDIAPLLILDDVIMSVDAGHRRRVCTLLTSEFPNYQFIVTTHDRTWMRQLVADRFARGDCVLQFRGWDLEQGPRVVGLRGDWEEIEEDLATNGVNSAAAQLRRNLEEFYSNMCEALEAKVVYRQDGQWEMGEILPPAVSKYKDLLKGAKAAANSWNDRRLVESLAEQGSVLAQCEGRAKTEGWALNPSVHFNPWENFTAEEFQLVIDAYRDLEALFRCANCESLVTLALQGHEPAALKCQCGQTNWNLQQKPRKP